MNSLDRWRSQATAIRTGPLETNAGEEITETGTTIGVATTDKETELAKAATMAMERKMGIAVVVDQPRSLRAKKTNKTPPPRTPTTQEQERGIKGKESTSTKTPTVTLAPRAADTDPSKPIIPSPPRYLLDAHERPPTSIPPLLPTLPPLRLPPLQSL